VSGRKRARIYIRESNERLAAGYSPAEMIRQCREKADRLNSDVVGEPVIEAAKRDELEAPELLTLLSAAERGDYDYLISWDMYRLTGELGKHLWFKQAIGRTQVTVHYVTVEFPDSEEGELFETMTGALGRFERAKTRARTQNGIRGKLQKGLPICNGPTPYGLVKLYDGRKPIGYGPDVERLAILKRIIHAVQTQTLARVCDQLNTDGVPTPTGRGVWQPGTITSLLGNATYRGDYRYGVMKVTPTRDSAGKRRYVQTLHDPSHVTSIPLDPFVDLADLARARAALSERRSIRRARRPEADDPFTLRGRLRCGHCGGVLKCDTDGRYRRYTCLRAYPHRPQRADPSFEGCPGRLPQILAGDLERHVWERVAERLADRDALEDALRRAADGGEQRKRYSEQRALLVREITRLGRRIMNGAIQLRDFDPSGDTYRTLLAGQRTDERAKQELEATLADLDGRAPVVLAAGDVDAIRTMWDDLAAGIIDTENDPSAQRTVYRAFEIRGVVTMVDGTGDGVRLGRDHEYEVALSGQVELDSRVKDTCGSLMLWSTQPADRPIGFALSLRSA
jgi:DNA invertase Pin-like site-specific DNA recombinase